MDNCLPGKRAEYEDQSFELSQESEKDVCDAFKLSNKQTNTRLGSEPYLKTTLKLMSRFSK